MALRALLLSTLVAGLLASRADACFVRSPQPVQVWLDHVRIDVINGIAAKSYECGFKNPNGGAIVGGECYMELEPGAQIDALSVSIDGKDYTAEILTVDEANEVFIDIVQKGGSPALLEYYGNQLIRTKLPHVPAGGTVVVKLRYTMPLKAAGDLYRISCLNTNPKALSQTLKAASVTIRIKSAEPVKTVYSPSHDLAFFEEDGWDVGIKWAAENYTPLSPFVLYYQTAPGKLAASLLAHRPPGEDGSFLLILSPTRGIKAADLSAGDVLPKDVVFCVDTSGSMLADGKMEQAKSALRYCVEQLRPGDHFNIVSFGTAVKSYQDTGLAEVNDSHRTAALAYIDALHARGGTAIGKALETAFGQLNSHGPASDRMPMLLFATDGLPTIGERDAGKILASADALNGGRVRLFAFGEGYDVNAPLLDALARGNNGETDYILPTEKIDERISRFFDRVGSPVLTDLQVQIDGLTTQDVFPATIPDLFLGEQVLLVGRYRGFGKKTVTLTGEAGGETRSYTYDVTFPEFTDADTADFVPRLWAGRKVDALLTRLRGQTPPDSAIVAELTALATRYGIVTPYTSFLLSKTAPTGSLLAMPAAGGAGFGLGGGGFGPQVRGSAPADAVAGRLALDAAVPMEFGLRREQVRGLKEVGDARRNAAKSGNATDFYRQAGEALRDYDSYRSGDVVDAPESAAEEQTKAALQAVRYIGERTFYNRGGQWQESLFDPTEDHAGRQVAIGSAEYLDLLKQDARLAKVFALGQVVVSVNGEWVEVQ